MTIVVSTKLSDLTSGFRPFVQLSGGTTVRTCEREFPCGPRHPIDCGFHWGRSSDHIIPPMADRGKRNTRIVVQTEDLISDYMTTF